VRVEEIAARRSTGGGHGGDRRGSKQLQLQQGGSSRCQWGSALHLQVSRIDTADRSADGARGAEWRRTQQGRPPRNVDDGRGRKYKKGRGGVGDEEEIGEKGEGRRVMRATEVECAGGVRAHRGRGELESGCEGTHDVCGQV
jgi:hypothetical protein